MKNYLAIGLMSGTSMDGVDAALLVTDGRSYVESLAHTSIQYPNDFQLLLKAAEALLNNKKGDLHQAAEDLPNFLSEYLQQQFQLNNIEVHDKACELTNNWQNSFHLFDSIIKHSTQFHAQAVNDLLVSSGYAAAQIDVIGFHGQTLYHAPHHSISIQAGDGQALAHMTGIPVINNFRQNDIANGGQGAPFVPLYHQALAVHHNRLPLGIINCGGIANITLINGASMLDVQAFDTGPGSVLLDRYIRQVSNAKETMDKDGRYGLQGQVNKNLLAALYQSSTITAEGNNYFELIPPKSLDSHACRLLPALFDLSIPDACATLAAHTAETIVRSLMHISASCPQHWVLAGGGWRNPVLYNELIRQLHAKLGRNTHIQLAEELGWNSVAIEAECFAYLAVRSLCKLPLSLPQTTGVLTAVTGGELYSPRQEMLCV